MSLRERLLSLGLGDVSYKNANRDYPDGTEIYELPKGLGWVAKPPDGPLVYIDREADATVIEKVDETVPK